MGGTCLFCLTPLLASLQSPQEPVYGWSRSTDVAVLIPCAAVLGVVSLADVPALTWVVSLLNQSAMADWQPSWLTCVAPLFYTIYAILSVLLSTKPQAERKYLQKALLIKDRHSKCTKNS